MRKELLIMILVLCSISVSALSMHIGTTTVRTVFRDLEVGDTVEGYVGVINNNDFPVKVEFGQPEVELVYLENTTVILGQGQEYNLNYTVTLTEPGSYSALIPILYTSIETGYNLGTGAELLFMDIIAEPEETTIITTTSSSGSSGGGSGGGAPVITPEPVEEEPVIIEPVEKEEEELEAVLMPDIENFNIPNNSLNSSGTCSLTTAKPRYTWVYLILAMLLITIVYPYIRHKRRGEPKEKEKES